MDTCFQVSKIRAITRKQPYSSLLACPVSASLMAIYTILVWLLIIALASLLHLFTHQRKEPRLAGYALPPGPKKLPIIGNLHQLGALPHRSLWLLSKKHGPLMHLQLGSMPTLVVSSADAAREILKTHDLDFCTRPQLIASQTYTYDCKDVSFSPYGEYWREMRKICILELFSSKRVESFRSVREEEVSLMIRSIARLSSTPVNVSKMVVALSSKIICRVAMGQRYQEGEYERSGFHDILEETRVMLGGFFVTDFFPSMGWVDRITGAVRRLERSKGKLDAFYEKVIEEHLDAERARPENEDVVDVLIRLQKDATYLTRDHIKAVLTDIFIAGTETAATTLIWAMAELARNPKLMTKAQEEVRASVGAKGEVVESDLHDLQYLKSVVKETLRLHTPVPLLLPREAVRHCKVDGYDILPNTRVFINAWAIGRDPKRWEDPEEFSPERFMGSSKDFRGHDFEFVPFGSGRRSCPAINMGVTTIELALANLLYSFEWELPVGMRREDMDMSDAPGLTVFRRSDLHLLATHYKIN